MVFTYLYEIYSINTFQHFGPQMYVFFKTAFCQYSHSSTSYKQAKHTENKQGSETNVNRSLVILSLTVQVQSAHVNSSLQA